MIFWLYLLLKNIETTPRRVRGNPSGLGPEHFATSSVAAETNTSL